MTWQVVSSYFPGGLIMFQDFPPTYQKLTKLTYNGECHSIIPGTLNTMRMGTVAVWYVHGVQARNPACSSLNLLSIADLIHSILNIENIVRESQLWHSPRSHSWEAGWCSLFSTHRACWAVKPQQTKQSWSTCMPVTMSAVVSVSSASGGLLSRPGALKLWIF